MRIEDMYPFEVDDIQLETIEPMPPEMNFTIERFHLPDNLVLSFEDLFFKGFMVDVLNQTDVVLMGFEGKTHLNLDPITYSSPIITAIGGTQGSPLNFKDVWDADQSGGWGVVHNNNNSNIQYEFQARLQLGNGTVAGTTWFNDTNVEIWSDPDLYSANHQWFIGVTDYAHLQLGQPNDLTQKTGSDGVMIYHSMYPYSADYGWRLGIDSISYDTSATVEIYDSKFFCNRTSSQISQIQGTGTLTVWGTILENTQFYITGGSIDAFDLIMAQGGEFLPYSTSPELTIDRLTFYDAYRSIVMWYARGYNASNIFQRGGTTQIISTQAITTNFYLINADLQAWTFRWGGTNTGEVYRQYEFDLTVTYPNGTAINGTQTGARATIRHYGQSEATDYNATLGEDGTITQQTLTMGFYNQTGGDTIYSYNPYNLRVWNVTDYDDYNGNFTLNAETDWIITLTEETAATEDETYVWWMLSLAWIPLVISFLIIARHNRKKREG